MAFLHSRFMFLRFSFLEDVFGVHFQPLVVRRELWNVVFLVTFPVRFAVVKLDGAVGGVAAYRGA